MYHQPVLAEQSIAFLNIHPDGIYVDATFGGGGHSRLILQQLSKKGQLYGFDQDEDAWKNKIDDVRFTLVQGNFRHLQRFMRLYGVTSIDGVLVDFGVSSHQLDEAERGFSYRFEADLDMRMNRQQPLTAAQVLNTYEEGHLKKIFGEYGEVRNARTLAQAIVTARQASPFAVINDLTALLEPLVMPKGQRLRYFSQVFQALRIEVNDEVGALSDFLKDTLTLLKPSGRLVAIAYHSLEDRCVKNFLRTGNINGEVQRNYFGHIFKPYDMITKKAIVPSQKEIQENSRSRSAKMRVGERLNIQAEDFSY